jgi:hypothetical protein
MTVRTRTTIATTAERHLLSRDEVVVKIDMAHL